MPSTAAFPDHLHTVEAGGEDAVPDLVEALIAESIAAGASDLHLRPAGDHIDVLFRLDGVLTPVATLRRDLQPNIVARFKILADLLTYRTDIPQEGRLRRVAGSDSPGRNGPSDLRVATFPTIYGEKVAVRIFDERREVQTLDSLGMPPEVLGPLQAALSKNEGTILLTGPAGSGKTTTLYAALRHLMSGGRERNIVTVEDPVETAIPGLTQTQVQPAAGLTFARCLRSLLRQDPEVIMIGEVRDAETAAIGIEAGLTGHLVLSTVHSGSACGVFTRLLEMGIEPYLLTSSVSGVVAQRLLRRLCGCARPAGRAGPPAPPRAGGTPAPRGAGVSPAPRGTGPYADDLEGAVVLDPVGCEECHGTGYRGRFLIAEWVSIEGEVGKAILGRRATPEIAEVARAAGMRPLRQAALTALRTGLTSVAELVRVMP
ncbi:MAG: type II/IV secretion system protein [Planctomycetes bacterium]|nr:type II/IV secretion system protein [Planctomycetota bacterium]